LSGFPRREDLQPVLQNLEQEVEKRRHTGREPAAHVFSDSRADLFPTISPGSRWPLPRPGGYGSIVFVSGTCHSKREIAPYLIVVRLEHMIIWARRRSRQSADHLVVILALINWLEVWASALTPDRHGWPRSTSFNSPTPLRAGVPRNLRW